MIESEGKSAAAVKAIDESALTKGQLRKLNALRKSVGPDIGERAFIEWMAAQAPREKTDKNIEAIESALWRLAQEGKLSIRRGGYLIRRGRGRLIVESARHENVRTSIEEDEMESVAWPSVTPTSERIIRETSVKRRQALEVLANR